MIPALPMQQDTIDTDERDRQLITSSTKEEARLPHQQPRHAATSVPGRRNKPSTSTPKQQKRRLRQAYARYIHLPKEMQDNEYITTGYRVEMGFLDSIKSMFGIHNETGNIWTHLIGIFVLPSSHGQSLSVARSTDAGLEAPHASSILQASCCSSSSQSSPCLPSLSHWR